MMAVCLSSMKSQRPTLRGVVFDMDGTLTVPNLDFKEMYRRCGVDPQLDILQEIASLPKEDANDKLAIIHEMEEEAVRTMQLVPGAVEVARWLKAHGLPTALVTRNTLQSAEALQQRIGGGGESRPFDIIISRDHHEKIPPKPDPSALHYIASQWNVEEMNTIVMVGDSPANDIKFGQAAGAFTAT